MLPDIDGFEVCRRIRRFSDCPIIFLTARTEEADKSSGSAWAGMITSSSRSARGTRGAYQGKPAAFDCCQQATVLTIAPMTRATMGRVRAALPGGAAVDGAMKRAVFDDCVLDLESYQPSVRGRRCQ